MASVNKQEDFQQLVLAQSEEMPVVVDFWAPWCEPCLMLEPIMNELADENKNNWRLVKINTDENPDIAAAYNVRGVPVVKIFFRGNVIASYNGLMWKKQFGQWIEENIANFLAAE
jgi:putative thioredoxin